MKDDSVNWGEVRAVLSSTILPTGKSVGMEPSTNIAREAIKVTTDIVVDFFNKHPGVKVMGANGEASAYFTANNIVTVANLVCNAVVKQLHATPTAPRTEPDVRKLVEAAKESRLAMNRIINGVSTGAITSEHDETMSYTMRHLTSWHNALSTALAAYEAATKTEGV